MYRADGIRNTTQKYILLQTHAHALIHSYVYSPSNHAVSETENALSIYLYYDKRVKQ